MNQFFCLFRNNGILNVWYKVRLIILHAIYKLYMKLNVIFSLSLSLSLIVVHYNYSIIILSSSSTSSSLSFSVFGIQSRIHAVWRAIGRQTNKNSYLLANHCVSMNFFFSLFEAQRWKNAELFFSSLSRYMKRHITHILQLNKTKKKTNFFFRVYSLLRQSFFSSFVCSFFIPLRSNAHISWL